MRSPVRARQVGLIEYTFFDFIILNCNKEVIFVHNLGSFDGFFIYKALSNRFKPEEVTCLIDNHNKFIQITNLVYF